MSRVRRNWTSKEDSLLRKLVANEIQNARPLLWRELAKQMPGRSNKDCRKRWWNSLAEGTTKGPWSPEEDKRLIKAVWEYKTNWNQVARVVGSRCADQCSSHWSQVLDPDINHCDWTSEEDEQLLHSVLSHGTNWSIIASSHKPQRTTLALKNRYSTLRLRHQNAGNWRASPSAKAPSSPSSDILNSMARSKVASNNEIQNDEAESEMDEEVDDESEEDGEEVRRNERPEESSAKVECSPFSLMSTPTSLSPYEIPNTAKDPEMSTGYTGASPTKIQPNYLMPNECVDQWMNVTMNNQPALYLNTESHLYPGEGFFNYIQDPSGMDINMEFSGRATDEEPVNMDFNFQGGSIFSKSETSNDASLILSGNTSPTPLYPCMDVSRLSPESLADSSVPEGNINLRGSQAGMHQVSITLVCTTNQLTQLMTSLATTGLAVSIKIDSQEQL